MQHSFATHKVHFVIDYGVQILDEEGVEVADVATARTEATKALAGDVHVARLWQLLEKMAAAATAARRLVLRFSMV